MRRQIRLVAIAWAFGATLAPAAAPDVIHLIPGVTTPARQPDGNSIVIDGPEGFIVFDTGRHPEHTQQIIDYARAGGRPVAAIINSHWHLDHVGGNLMLREAYPDVRVYASGALTGALGGFLRTYRDQLAVALAQSQDPQAVTGLRAEIALIDAGPKLGPTDVIAASKTFDIAGRRLELHFERAVTAGDLWVFDEATATLLAGDLVTLPAPFFDTACPENWRVALAGVSQWPFKQLIPGHGAPMVRAGFDTYRRAFDALLDCAAGKGAKADCVEGWVKDAGSLIPEGDRAFARGLVDYYVDAVLRGHDDKRAKLCATES
ncbi:MAG TPA: MBL fold metallo-hydrolase [Steroidobacteraceae bacterium]|nr:MBL fold metallo-hydrolase [Steroidobacteraceae bacterium]